VYKRQGSARTKQTLQLLFVALGALGEYLVIDSLKDLKLMSTCIAFVVVRWHIVN